MLKRLDKGESGTKLAVEFGAGKATIKTGRRLEEKLGQD